MIKLIKNISSIILNLLRIFLTIGFIWSMFWVSCALSDQCYYNQFIGGF